jgi:hypothetical protein
MTMTNSSSDMTSPVQDEALTLARRLMLDVRQLIKTRGEKGAALALVARRLGVTIEDVVAAVPFGIEQGLLVQLDDHHLGLGEKAKAAFARGKMQLRTYPVEAPAKRGPPRRYDKVLRSRRRGVRTEFDTFKQRRAKLKAFLAAN